VSARKKKKLFENQAPQVLLQQNPLEIKYPSSVRSAKKLGIKHLVLLHMQEMKYDVLFSVFDVTATKKKPSKNFRNHNTLVLLGLPKKKTP
jgi:hypothetical protein